MTTAPDDLKVFRANVMNVCGFTDPNDVGIVGDAAHAARGGYHISGTDIRNAGMFDTDYSTKRARDHFLPNPYASAVDIGDNWPRGGRAAWLRFNNLFVSHLVAGDPALNAVRAVNFSRDGIERKRFDTANRSSGIINSTDTVTIHTHIEWWRDTVNSASRAASLTAILGYIRAARDYTSQASKGATMGVLTAPDGHEGDVFYTLTSVPTPEGTRVPAHVVLARLLADVAAIKAQAGSPVDVNALAAALAPQLSLSKDAVVAAMQAPEVSAVIYQQSLAADQAAEDS